MLPPADLGHPTEVVSIQNVLTHPVKADVAVSTWDDHQFDDSLEWPYSFESHDGVKWNLARCTALQMIRTLSKNANVSICVHVLE